MNVHVPIFTYSPNALMQIRYLEGGFFFHIQNAIEVFFPHSTCKGRCNIHEV
jgi:hypothetical protein